jgi:ATP-binding cassette subfamily B (MDR/TAP) protein 1
MKAEEEKEVEKERDKKYAQRARLLAKGDGFYLFVGSVGAVLAGLVFPAWGFVFAFMVELLYYRIEECDDNLDPPISYFPEFEECQDYWDDAADFMRDLSFKVFYGLLGLMVSCMIGNVLLHYGFGTATERMNKRVRDSAFKNLIRQEVSWFDVRPVGTLTTQLSDDAAMIHSFSGQPLRMFIMNLSSVVVGLIVAFIYMW